MDYTKINWIGEEAIKEIADIKASKDVDKHDGLKFFEKHADVKSLPITIKTLGLVTRCGSYSLLKDALNTYKTHGVKLNNDILSDLLIKVCLNHTLNHAFEKAKYKIKREQPYLLMAQHLIDKGADVNYLKTESFVNGQPIYSTPIFNALNNHSMMDLLLLNGADVNAGSALDKRAVNKSSQTSLLVNWFEWYDSKYKKDSLMMLEKLKVNGIDFNQPMRGWRFSENEHNFLCEAWRIYNFNWVIPEMLKLGLDPYQEGVNGVSLHKMLKLNSIMESTNNDKISYKQRARAEKMLEWLESNYPKPQKNIKIKMK